MIHFKKIHANGSVWYGETDAELGKTGTAKVRCLYKLNGHIDLQQTAVLIGNNEAASLADNTDGWQQISVEDYAQTLRILQSYDRQREAADGYAAPLLH